MLELSLFTGAGGGILGTHLLGWRPVGYVEFNDYCQRVLAQRIKDGHIPNAPIFGDIRAFLSQGYAASYTGMVDVVTAGFPCHPFSCAGQQRGENDPRNMWPATRDTLRIVRPRYALLENVPGLLARSHGYFGIILRDLAEMGYDARWGVLGACYVGASHSRERLWTVAYSRKDRRGLLSHESRHSKRTHCAGSGYIGPYSKAWDTLPSPEFWGGSDGLPSWVGDGWAAVGNAQVPAVVRLAWEVLSEDI